MRSNGHFLIIALVLAMSAAAGTVLGADRQIGPDETCSLALNVVEQESSALQSDSTIYLYMPDKMSVHKAVAKEGKLIFQKLGSGEYGVMAEKAGFSNSYFKIELDCASLGDEAMRRVRIPLWKSAKRDVLRLKFEDESGRLILNDPLQLGRHKPDGPSDPKVVESGVISGRALKLVKPEYPDAARLSNTRGSVQVRVTIGYDGLIESAEAIKGSPLLREAAENAARQSVFAPTYLDGAPVKVVGVIVYSFR